MPSNGDTNRVIKVDGEDVHGLGSFHKTLPHNLYGEVDAAAFAALKAASQEPPSGPFGRVTPGAHGGAPFTNPQAGLARDRLVSVPTTYSMPPAPAVDSESTAAEMTELYWMALLRDVSLDDFSTHAGVAKAAGEVGQCFANARALRPGVDLPGHEGAPAAITPQNLFRLGLPGEDRGPLVSQFFVRPVSFGTQTIDQQQRPYAGSRDYLTSFDAWLEAQNSGRDRAGQAYGESNEDDAANFEGDSRYIGTLRDLARFVNKDALHQAYFNAALLLLSGQAKWTPGNPYVDRGRFHPREAGFGVLGGPHILALVSEVATRALKVVWRQKWQVHLRLRPEAYGGLVHVQARGVGAGNKKRAYGLPAWVAGTTAAREVEARFKSLLLPMAYTQGSPTHPAYGAGHATVAGACVTVLKAWFRTLDDANSPLALSTLMERAEPYGARHPFACYLTGVDAKGQGRRTLLAEPVARTLTIEGELNKLAMNVAMGRSMGGVHWRTDNARSLVLGEALAAQILADIAQDCHEKPSFIFRTFARGSNGLPRIVRIDPDTVQGATTGVISVEGVRVPRDPSEL